MSPNSHSNNIITICLHKYFWECSQSQLAQCQTYRSSMVLSVSSYKPPGVALAWLVKLDFYRKMTCCIPLKVCSGTRIILCSQGIWCSGVKIGPGASFAGRINLIQKLRCHHVAQMCHHRWFWIPYFGLCHSRANLQSKHAYTMARSIFQSSEIRGLNIPHFHTSSRFLGVATVWSNYISI